MVGYIGSKAVTLSTTAADVTGDATINGNLTVKGTTVTIDSAAAQEIRLGDNDKLTFGDATGGDLQIYHDGSNSYIEDAGTGWLLLKGNDSGVAAQDGSGNYVWYANQNGFGAYYNNSVKLATTSTGVDITGTLTSDGLTVDGTASVSGTTTLADGTTGEMLLGLGTALVTGAGTYDSAIRTNGGGGLLMSTGTTKRLSINTIGDISFYEDTGTTPKFFWDASAESLGIGTSSPSTLMHISGSSSSVDGIHYIVENTRSAGGPAGIVMKSNHGDWKMINSQTVADALEFIDGSAGATRMLIDSSGRVGIGTSSPTRKLEVVDNGDILQLTGIAGNAFVRFTDNDASSDFSIGSDDGSGAGVGAFMVYDRNNTAYRMIINSSGNVGIGTTSPTQKLEVSGGNIQVDSFSRKIGFKVSGNSNAGYLIPYDGSGNTQLVNERSSGNLIFKSANTEALRITSGGGLNLGTTGLPTSGNAGVSLQPAGNVHCGLASTAAADVMRFDNPNGRVGSISVTGTTTSYNTSSDYRLKENVTDVTDGITRVKQLAPKRFNFIADPDKTVDGFIAHEVQDVIPEAISGAKDAMRDEEYEVTPAVEATFDEDGNVLTEAVDAVMGTRSVPDYQGIDQSKLVPLLTAALQEAIAKIETLETEMTSVKARLDALEGN